MFPLASLVACDHCDTVRQNKNLWRSKNHTNKLKAQLLYRASGANMLIGNHAKKLKTENFSTELCKAKPVAWIAAPCSDLALLEGFSSELAFRARSFGAPTCSRNSYLLNIIGSVEINQDKKRFTCLTDAAQLLDCNIHTHLKNMFWCFVVKLFFPSTYFEKFVYRNLQERSESA